MCVCARTRCCCCYWRWRRRRRWNRFLWLNRILPNAHTHTSAANTQHNISSRSRQAGGNGAATMEPVENSWSRSRSSRSCVPFPSATFALLHALYTSCSHHSAPSTPLSLSDRSRERDERQRRNEREKKKERERVLYPLYSRQERFRFLCWCASCCYMAMRQGGWWRGRAALG